MRKTLGLVAAGLTTAGMAVTATPAAAANPPSAKVISVSDVQITADRRHVQVAGTYSCTGAYHHLWVSAKQGPGDLRVEGSGAIAKSWYQVTHDNFPQGGNGSEVVKCDGRVHTIIVTLPRTKGRMHIGKSYVQFCLLTGYGANPGVPGTSFASNQQYRSVYKV